MFQTSKNDLLLSTMKFQLVPEDDRPDQVNLIRLVSDGKITTINEVFQQIQKQALNEGVSENDIAEEISAMVNRTDREGKSPLFYACYYNYKNLVVYLLTKGANPYKVNQKGENVFHIMCYYGRMEAAFFVQNHEKHLLRMKLKSLVKQLMKEYQFKRSDVSFGVLISPEKHIVEVQQRFLEFQDKMNNLYEQGLNALIQNYKAAMNQIDSNGRNPIHYGALSKYTNSFKTMRYLLDCNLGLEGYEEFDQWFQELQNLELSREKKIDTRQYLNVLQMFQNYITKEKFSRLNKNFEYDLKILKTQMINCQDNEGYSPMHLASFHGDFAVIQHLLRLGANPKITESKSQKEVLDFASNDQVRKYLIDLKDAARKGDEKSFQLLLNCGHQIDGKKTIFGIAPIQNAIEYSHYKSDENLLKLIIKCGADVNTSDSNGWTPLHHACEYGDQNIIEMLLRNGADMYKFSNKGYYPIHIAALNNHYEIIEVLLNENQERKDLLLEAQADGNFTPLHLASKKGHLQSMEMLLNHGANPYSVDLWKWNALHHACFNYKKQAVKLLCRFDADYEKLRNMKNSKGKVAKQLVNNSDLQFQFNTLWFAAATGNLDVVRKLTIMGENINDTTRDKKNTPLILATINEHLLVVKFLLDNQADENIRNIESKIAKEYAYDLNNLGIIKLFERTEI